MTALWRDSLLYKGGGWRGSDMLSESEICKGARVLKLSGQHPCQNRTIQFRSRRRWQWVWTINIACDWSLQLQIFQVFTRFWEKENPVVSLCTWRNQTVFMSRQSRGRSLPLFCTRVPQMTRSPNHFQYLQWCTHHHIFYNSVVKTKLFNKWMASHGQYI